MGLIKRKKREAKTQVIETYQSEQQKPNQTKKKTNKQRNQEKNSKARLRDL